MFDQSGLLKLQAQDKNDLKFLSAYLQDLIIIPQDIKFLKKNKMLVCIFNRFMWENFGNKKDISIQSKDNKKRIRSALTIKNVVDVKSKYLNSSKNSEALEFLTFEIFENKKNNININLIFSGNSIISVTVELIDLTLEDFSDTWSAKKVPEHKI